MIRKVVFDGVNREISTEDSICASRFPLTSSFVPPELVFPSGRIAAVKDGPPISATAFAYMPLHDFDPFGSSIPRSRLAFAMT
jgi:hypothetical protein